MVNVTVRQREIIRQRIILPVIKIRTLVSLKKGAAWHATKWDNWGAANPKNKPTRTSSRRFKALDSPSRIAFPNNYSLVNIENGSFTCYSRSVPPKCKKSSNRCRPKRCKNVNRAPFAPEPLCQQHPAGDPGCYRRLCGSNCAAVEYPIYKVVFVAIQGECETGSYPELYWLFAQQMLTIAFHEFGHAMAACVTGGRVKSISLDPREGGVTHMQGGISAITLPAGYLGSSLIGALLIFCGFDIVASKIASIVLGVCFLLTLWWARRDWLTISTVLLAVGLLVACWFIKHAEPLRFVVVGDCGFMNPGNNLLT